MKISYAILTHNEGECIAELLTLLTTYKRDIDEIVVVDDYSNDERTKFILNDVKDLIKLEYRTFDGDHTQKNYLNSLCSGDYILQLDADELVSLEFLNMLPNLLELNDTVDLFIMPRINTVEGLTPEWSSRWGWRVNEKGWVNFPDYQWRIYKNSPDIKWKNRVHEVLDGYKTYSNLPEMEEYALYHPKTIWKQESQNNFYSRL